jgi:HSP20 family protein
MIGYYEELNEMMRRLRKSDFIKSAEEAFSKYLERSGGLRGKESEKQKEPGNECRCGRPVRERVFKEHGDMVIKIPVPGLKRENLDIKVLGRVLTVTAVNIEEDGNGFVENGYSRTYNVWKSHDLKKASAKLSDGVLTITVPASEDAKPDEIQINID